VVLGAALIPAAVPAQNQVQNPDFDAGIATFWTASTNGACPGCSAALDNVNGHFTTPSARLSTTSGGGLQQILTSDCTPNSTPTTLDLGYSRRTNAVDANATPGGLFQYWSDAACTMSIGFTSPVTSVTVAGWEEISETAIVPPALNGFFTVRLSAGLNNPGVISDFSFDRVYLGPPGTLPVELLSFGVE
jgi:hypothetical protein